MSRLGHVTRSRAIAIVHHGEPSTANPQGQIPQEQRANDMFSTMLILLQQQATRLSYVEQNQQIIFQMMNNHVQSNLHNVL
jgi:hypothetical protein